MPIFDDSDFAHLTPSGTARFVLQAVRIPRTNPDPVVLVLKHAGESNERYQSAMMKATRGTGKDVTKHLATIYAKHVIAGWENVRDRDGRPIAYTADGGEELLHRLIDAKRTDAELASLVVFARNHDNFRDPTVDPVDLGNG